jgi:hypothetical protein
MAMAGYVVGCRDEGSMRSLEVFNMTYSAEMCVGTSTNGGQLLHGSECGRVANGQKKNDNLSSNLISGTGSSSRGTAIWVMKYPTRRD